MLCKAVLSLSAILYFISLNVCLGVLHIISLYGVLSLHNSAHLQVLFSFYCGIIRRNHALKTITLTCYKYYNLFILTQLLQ